MEKNGIQICFHMCSYRNVINISVFILFCIGNECVGFDTVNLTVIAMLRLEQYKKRSM